MGEEGRGREWGWEGGEPRPTGKAPDRERAGFWTAIICPPEAERT